MLDLLPRGLSGNIPEHRTRHDNHATLLVSWWCTAFALVIILLRVCGRFVRTERLFTEDKIMFWSIVPLLIRMGLVHVIMLYGTNNSTTADLPAVAIYDRAIGSKLVLASRIFYALFIWTAKWTVSEFLKRLTTATWNPTHERVLRIIRAFLALTFLGVVIGTLAECQPFDHYWQVIPDPGPRCRDGYVQLLTMGISDSFTDILLIVFPIPIILRSQMPKKRKLSLSLLFMLSTILIVITVIRMVSIIHVHGSQQRRTLWASIEILAAAAVSNAVILGSFVRDRGVKKVKYKSSTTGRMDSDGPSISRKMTAQHWGSDSDVDLFRSLGCRLESVNDHVDAEQAVDAPLVKATDMTHLDPNGHLDDIRGNHQPDGAQSFADVLLSERIDFAAPRQQERRDRLLLDPNRSPVSDIADECSPTDVRPSPFLRGNPVPRLLHEQTFGFVDQDLQRGSEISLVDAGGLLSSGPSHVTSSRIAARPHTPTSTLAAFRGRSSASRSRDRGDQRIPGPSRFSQSREPAASRSRTGGPEDMNLSDAGGLLS